jgi:hypothetical protein
MATPDDRDDPEREVEDFRERVAKNKEKMRENLSEANPDELRDAAVKLKLLACLEDILEFIYKPSCITP